MPTRTKHHQADAGTFSALGALMHELKLHDDAAELRAFIALCRRSLRLRTWLFGRFAPEPATQAAFRAFLSDPGAGEGGLWSPELDAQVRSHAPLAAAMQGPHGGLSDYAIWSLIKHYQAGQRDVLTFFLVRIWRDLPPGDVTPALWTATLNQWAAIVRDDSGQRARELAQAIAFIQSGADIVPESWKIHVLLYILQHPQPAYRVGELFDQLPEKFRKIRANGNPFVDRREVRKFCERHGIRRDTRAGAPRRKPTPRDPPARSL